MAAKKKPGPKKKAKPETESVVSAIRDQAEHDRAGADFQNDYLCAVDELLWSKRLAAMGLAIAQAAEEHERVYWPQGEEIPHTIIKAKYQTIPCPECRRVILGNGSRSARCMSTRREESIAYYMCVFCGHRWKLTIKEVG